MEQPPEAIKVKTPSVNKEETEVKQTQEENPESKPAQEDLSKPKTKQVNPVGFYKSLQNLIVN